MTSTPADDHADPKPSAAKAKATKRAWLSAATVMGGLVVSAATRWLSGMLTELEDELAAAHGHRAMWTERARLAEAALERAGLPLPYGPLPQPVPQEGELPDDLTTPEASLHGPGPGSEDQAPDGT
jgi:hypothetical protein